MAEHLGVRSRRNGVVFILVSGNEVAESVEVQLRAIVKFALGEKLVHDFPSLLKMLVGFDRGERKGQHELKVGVSACSLQAELRLHRHVSSPSSGPPGAGRLLFLRWRGWVKASAF